MGHTSSKVLASKFRMALAAAAIASLLLAATGSAGVAHAAPTKAPAIWAGVTNNSEDATVRVDGAYFAAESAVTVYFDGTAVTTTMTRSSGVFTAVFKHQSATGSHVVKAVDASGLESSVSSVSSVSLQQLLPRTGTYIALYMPPTGTGWAEWQKIIGAKRAHPSVPVVVTINPSSGAGSYRDSNFAWGIAQLREAGIIVLGYVYDSYGVRPLDQIKSEASNYLDWYRVDGLFIDEFTNKAGYEWHYGQITSYAKSIGLKMTMGNPGTDVPQSYIGAVDVLNITEGRGYMPLSWLQFCVLCSDSEGWHYQYDKRNFSYIRYAASTLDADFVQQSAEWAGLVSVTDGVDPGRFFNVPPYFAATMDLLD